MQQNDFNASTSYPYPQAYSYQPSYSSTAPVDVIDRVPATPNPGEQYVYQPYAYSPEPTTAPPTPPRRKPGLGRIIALLALVLALIFGVGLLAGWSSTRTNSSSTPAAAPSITSSSGTTLEAMQEAAIAKIEPSVVELQVTTAQGSQLGSGVIIDAKGDIITNNHVVDGGQNIEVVLSNGKTEQGQLVGTVAADDLAVVRIAPYANMTYAQIANSSSLVVGQEVLAVGNPLGITETATKGIISALNRSVSESASVTISNAIQTDAPINPGNSGGALINLQGQLVGITTLNAVNTESNTAAEGLGFAIPSNLVQTALQQVL